MESCWSVWSLHLDRFYFSIPGLDCCSVCSSSSHSFLAGYFFLLYIIKTVSLFLLCRSLWRDPALIQPRAWRRSKLLLSPWRRTPGMLIFVRVTLKFGKSKYYGAKKKMDQDAEIPCVVPESFFADSGESEYFSSHAPKNNRSLIAGVFSHSITPHQ